MLLTNATLADRSTVDVRLCPATGTIDAVADSLAPQAGEQVCDLTGHLLLPAPAEPHAHLDKAFLAERIDNPTGDLMGAIRALEANRQLITVDDTIERAERAVRLIASNGATAIRSHVDVTAENGLRSAEALIEVRRRVAQLVDLQIVALMGWPIAGLAGADTRALARDALDMGVDIVGGCPHLDSDPTEATDAFLALAADLGRDVDLHTDETLSPEALALEHLANVVAAGFPHAVTASHCVSLGVQPPDVQRRVADKVAAARIGVVALPQTNLYLQGREQPVATPRGLTAVAALRAAGATVAAGADNLQDPFNLVGKGDPFETAALMVMAAHLLPVDAYAACSTAARRVMGLSDNSLVAGAQADLVAMKASSLREAIAFQGAGRMVFRRGELIKSSTSAGC